MSGSIRNSGNRGESHTTPAEPGDTLKVPGPDGPPEEGRTIRDVRTLWGGAVSPDASPGSSIKAAGIGEGLEAASKLLPCLRRLSKAKEEKEKPEESDFELIELLGKGGMGMVFLARQKSLDREVAVKVIQPQAAEDAEARGKFFAEALVTGELDHPNIVPVYDFGGTPEGVLFYPMKQVRGASWDKAIQQKSLEENLSILNSVCDAVAFGHDKGVIHRDLKPENVMLGDYGEVFVMDWGLAASVGSGKAEALTPESGLAGTPAYMAPEMAACDLAKIGPASDIYLLGGILYEIVTGLRPHTGEDAYACIHAAMENIIQPTEKKGELVEIALKAMATEPHERYKSVKEFQRAIREYGSHAESLKLSAAADERLSRARGKPKAEVYRELTETIAGYQQAIELWSQNESAILGLRRARETFVEVALERGDLALAQSQVAAIEEECGKLVLVEKGPKGPEDLAERVSLATAQAARKEKIARLSRRAAIATTALIIIVTSTAYLITRAARNRAVAAQRRALSAKAEESRQRQKAEEALRTAERENYYNIIALADAKTANSLYDQAEALLWTAPRQLRGWEWGRLMHVCHQELLALKGHSDTVLSVAFSRDGSRVVTGSRDSTAKLWDAETGQELLTLQGHSAPVPSAAFSPDGERVVTASSDNKAKLWDAKTGKELLTLEGHSDRVLSVAFSSDGTRVVTGGGDLTAGVDDTARVWDAQTGKELLAVKGHSKQVNSVAFSPDGRRVATASSDNTARVWDAETGQELLKLWPDGQPDPEVLQFPIHSVAFSPDGMRIVTGGDSRTVKILDAETGREISALSGHSRSVESAVFSPDGKRILTGGWDRTAKVWDAESGQEILTLKGRSSVIFCVAFSPDGKRVATASMDQTAKIWDAEKVQDVPTLTGHLEVTCVGFSPDGTRVVTGSSHGTARVWDTESGREILTPGGTHGTDAGRHRCRLFAGREASRDGKQIEHSDDLRRANRPGDLFDRVAGSVGSVLRILFTGRVPAGHRKVGGGDALDR